MKVLVFDVETTGLPEKYASIRQTWRWPYIVQFSWMVYDTSNNKLISLDDHIINLPKKIKIDNESIKIHGITNEKMRAKGENKRVILEKFMNDVKSATILVAHNLKFDLSMVSVEQIRLNKRNIKTLIDCRKQKYCTMNEGKIIANLYYFNRYKEKMMLKPPKLIELHERLFKSVPNNLHNSLIDILVCFRCFGKLYWDVDILDVNTKLSKLFKTFC